jgi:diamine N-acetyltransferase
VNVSDIDAISGTCRIGLAVFAPADRGKGYGRRIMDLMLGYCREWLNIRKVNLIVLADNKAAVTLYEKCGFVVEGTLRDEYFLDGRYRTALTMARFLR